MATKICFIGGARYHRPLDETSAKKFRAMTSLGEIFVIGFSSDLKPRIFTEYAQFYLLPQLWLPVLRYFELFVLGQILAFWLIVRHRIQVVVAQSPYEAVAGALAKITAGWLGCNVALVVENHGDFEESVFLQRRVRWLKAYRFLMRHMAVFALKRADILRSISNSTRCQLEKWMPGRRIVQFPTWTDIEPFLEASGTRHQDGDSQEILYTGVLIPRKGVHHLLSAFSRISNDIRNARLVIVGQEENENYASGLKEQVKRLGLKDRVLFLPPMPQAELAYWMSRARVFVLPSISEGLGRVVFEAMASGTPVVGSDIGGIPDMVKNGFTGFLVRPGDEVALADRLQWILKHPAEAQAMSSRARRFAEKFFSPEAYVRGYRKVFTIARGTLKRSASI